MKITDKIIILAAASLFAGACSTYERDFTVHTGSTPVEFVSTLDTADLASEYLNIPIRMTEQSATSSLAVVRFISGEITASDGSLIPVEENKHILITSNEIYIGAYNEAEDGDNLPEGILEVKIPGYRDYLSISLTFALSGEYVGTNASTTVTLIQPDKVQIEGQYAIDPSFILADGSTADPYTFTILPDENDPNKYWFINLEGANTTRRSLYGILELNTMTIPTDQENLVIPPVAGGVVTVGICPGGQIENGEPVLEFTDEGIIFRNGFWAGEVSGSSVSAYSFIAEGDVAVRM